MTAKETEQVRHVKIELKGPFSLDRIEIPDGHFLDGDAFCAGVLRFLPHAQPAQAQGVDDLPPLPEPAAWRTQDEWPMCYQYTHDEPDEERIRWAARYGRKHETVFTANQMRDYARAALAKRPDAAEHWHRLYLEKCQQHNDRIAVLGAEIEALEALAQQPEPVVRFCPGCGSVGEVPNKYRDCCPDGSHARMIPESLAHRCHDLFTLALDAAQQPEPASTAEGRILVFMVDTYHVEISCQHPIPDATAEAIKSGLQRALRVEPPATFTHPDPDLNDLLNLTADYVHGRATGDGALAWAEALERVEKRLQSEPVAAVPATWPVPQTIEEARKWRIVPVEPTTGMLIAGNHCQPGDYSAAMVWEKMLGAADRASELSYTRPSMADVIAASQTVAAVPDARIAEAVKEAVAAIYFADSSDYKPALWSVVRALSPDLAELLETDGSAAYHQADKRAMLAAAPTPQEGPAA